MEDNKCCSVSTKLPLILSIVALLVAGLTYFRPGKKVEDVGKVDDRLRELVVRTIKENPQLIVDAMGEGMAKKRDESLKHLSQDVIANKDEITKQCIKLGDQSSKTSIIAFIDPVCKHCVEFQRDMAKVIAAKKDVCFKVVPVAVIGDDSVMLAKVYYAIHAKAPEKVLPFIEAITKHEGEVDKNTIEKALKVVGLSSKEIEPLLSDADKNVAANGQLAEKIKVPVVPILFLQKGNEATMIQPAGLDGILAAIGGATAPAQTGPQKKS